MGFGPVTRPTSVGSWRLTPAHAKNTQGLLASPFGHLPEACALFVQLSRGGTGAWIAAIRAACPITDATGQATPSAAMAFTWSGLEAMGLDDATLATFSPAFQEGMHQIDRQRRLSDIAESGTVLEGGPRWGGNPARSLTGAVESLSTPITVHAVLLLYAEDTATLAAQVVMAEAALKTGGATVSHRLALSLRYDATKRAREHFGFADGISQPVPQGEAIVSDSGSPLPLDPLHGIAAGDVLLGHCNAQGEPAPGPMVSVALCHMEELTKQGAPEGFRNLGLDGSYLVLRELRQDVAAFWMSMHNEMASSNPIDAIWLANRVVGRTMDGDPLIPGGTLPPLGDDPRNDFTYFATDPHGLGCPVGAHVRRANPRDGLAPNADSAPDLLAAAQNHRILRRGRKFGPTIVDPLVDDGAERGLLFMCLNTDLVRQFEFVQQTWMLNTNFGTLLNETDPLLGPAGRFTVPAERMRLRPTVQTFVRFAGGEYFFLPSLPALDFLQTLPAEVVT